MQTLYSATVYASAVICLLTALVLFLRRRDGERSRTILAFIVLLSVFSYTNRFVNILEGHVPPLAVSVPMLLVGLVMVISYIMYPIEVVSPGWLNLKRVALLYSPVAALAGIWGLTLWAGVDYTAYGSLGEMLPDALRFDAGFRLILCLVVFAPLAAIFFVPYTRRYNNTDRAWMRTYATVFTINTLAYLVVLSTDSQLINTLYYYISVGCSLYIAYIELFVRLIGKPVALETAQTNAPAPQVRTIVQTKNSAVFERLDNYMREGKVWRDPDLQMARVVSEVYTNRTTLTQALHEQGYEGYTAYVNSLRVADFLEIMQGDAAGGFQNAFFDAGFRSRNTANRNFKLATGMTATEYFRDRRK